MFFVVMAPICGGPPDKRKCVAFDALLCRPMDEGISHIKKVDATR